MNLLEATLETSDGHYVVTAQIPPFQKLPAVLIWGERVFVLHSESKGLVYRECFAVTVVQTVDRPPAA